MGSRNSDSTALTQPWAAPHTPHSHIIQHFSSSANITTALLPPWNPSLSHPTLWTPPASTCHQLPNSNNRESSDTCHHAGPHRSVLTPWCSTPPSSTTTLLTYPPVPPMQWDAQLHHV